MYLKGREKPFPFSQSTYKPRARVNEVSPTYMCTPYQSPNFPIHRRRVFTATLVIAASQRITTDSIIFCIHVALNLRHTQKAKTYTTLTSKSDSQISINISSCRQFGISEHLRCSQFSFFLFLIISFQRVLSFLHLIVNSHHKQQLLS